MTPVVVAQLGIAVLAASLAPALVFAAMSGSFALLTVAFVIALAHAVVLGLPLFLLLRRKGWVNGVSTTIGGLIVGATPVAVLTWPLRYSDLRSNSWIGPDRVQTMIDGAPTVAGWLQYAQGSLYLGAFGLLGGLAFWATLRLTGQLPARESLGPVSASPQRHARLAKRAVLIGVPILALGAAAVPVLTKDRSCHNLLRDGRSSISPVARLELQVDDQEWPALIDVMRRVGTNHRLSIRDNSKVTPDVARTLYLSACNDGVNIEVAEQRWAHNDYKSLLGDRGVSIAVYSQHDGSYWPRVAKPLVESLEARWPGRLRFRGDRGEITPKPTELISRDK